MFISAKHSTWYVVVPGTWAMLHAVKEMIEKLFLHLQGSMEAFPLGKIVDGVLWD